MMLQPNGQQESSSEPTTKNDGRQPPPPSTATTAATTTDHSNAEEPKVEEQHEPRKHEDVVKLLDPAKNGDTSTTSPVVENGTVGEHSLAKLPVNGHNNHKDISSSKVAENNSRREDPKEESKPNSPTTTSSSTEQRKVTPPSPDPAMSWSLVLRLQEAQVALTSAADSRISKESSHPANMATTSASTTSSFLQRELVQSLQQSTTSSSNKNPTTVLTTTPTTTQRTEQKNGTTNGHQQKNPVQPHNNSTPIHSSCSGPATTTSTNASPGTGKAAAAVDTSRERSNSRVTPDEPTKSPAGAGDDQDGSSDGNKDYAVDMMDIDNKNNPDNSSTSSPTIVDDEDLLKTDEELPPFDFDVTPSAEVNHVPEAYYNNNNMYASSSAPEHTLARTPPYYPAVNGGGATVAGQAKATTGAYNPGTQRIVAAAATNGTQQGRHQQSSRPHPSNTADPYQITQHVQVGASQAHQSYHPSQYYTGAPPTHPYPHPSHHAHPTQHATTSNRNHHPAGPTQRHSYPAGPTAAVKPIRRLAKIRPYANQNIPVSAQEIKQAIPKDASSVFHVMDRRVNLDAMDAGGGSSSHRKDVNVPIYAMLRAWVQDDPYRQIPSRFPTLISMHGVDSAAVATIAVNMDDTAARSKRGRDDEALIVDSSPEKKQKATVDMASILATAQQTSSSDNAPSMEALKNEIVQHAKQTRKRKSQKYKRQLNQTLEGLRQRGILVG